MPTRDIHGPVVNPRLKAFVDVGLQGKVVGQGRALAQAEAGLQHAGSRILGRLDVVEASPGLYASRLTIEGKTSDSYAVPVGDANGAARRSRPVVDATRGSWFENEVQTSLDVPRIGRHLLCRHPRPLPSGSEAEEVWRRPRAEWAAHRAQERIVVTREMSAAAPVLEIRPGPEWKPFMEDVVIEPRRASSENAGQAPLALVISLDAEPLALIEAVGFLYGVDAVGLATREGWCEELLRLRPR
jgi:hypothetical protein